MAATALRERKKPESFMDKALIQQKKSQEAGAASVWAPRRSEDRDRKIGRPV
jgi:hypothetical protein